MTEGDLRARFGRQAVDALIALLRSGQTPEIDPQVFEAKLAEEGIVIEAVGLLDAAAEARLVERIRTWRCSTCRRIIDADAVANHQCPYCRSDFRETGDDPVNANVYRGHTAISRSVPWLIAIHGFNTRGPWQEDFSWRIAHRFKYHAPVLIYKYGLVRFGVLFRWRHTMLARDLNERIRNAIAYARQNEIEEPPDIVIHSFGSQLFRLVLDMPESSDLRFGRVIAVGSVIRPDFDWSKYLRNGQIEAVLCQCGALDRAVPFAQFFIPNTGPGGRYGFNDTTVINVRDAQYSHSTAFTAEELARNLTHGGRWDRFLREPLAMFSDPSQFKPSAWSPSCALMRYFTRVSVILSICATALALVLLPARLLWRCLSSI
jgi:hypothetical protein